VLSAAISLELYRQFGYHERKRKTTSSRSRWKTTLYPWEKQGDDDVGDEVEFNHERYPANG
jgi:hypothetical protein